MWPMNRAIWLRFIYVQTLSMYSTIDQTHTILFLRLLDKNMFFNVDFIQVITNNRIFLSQVLSFINYPRLFPWILGRCWRVWSPLRRVGSLSQSRCAHLMLVTRLLIRLLTRGRASGTALTPDWRLRPKPSVNILQTGRRALINKPWAPSWDTNSLCIIFFFDFFSYVLPSNQEVRSCIYTGRIDSKQGVFCQPTEVLQSVCGIWRLYKISLVKRGARTIKESGIQGPKFCQFQ